jgi:hypothetical protein
VFHDPSDDLTRRSERWNHDLPEGDLGSLALFAAGLAGAESEAWVSGSADVATAAYEERRFLLADRIIHWAVPWLESVRVHHPDYHDMAEADLNFLLHLGDDMRVAPLLPGKEGILVEGDDSYGPVGVGHDHHHWHLSLWSGAVVMHIHETAHLARYYAETALRWEAIAMTHTGSAQLWTDLAIRAMTTASQLG